MPFLLSAIGTGELPVTWEHSHHSSLFLVALSVLLVNSPPPHTHLLKKTLLKVKVKFYLLPQSFPAYFAPCWPFWLLILIALIFCTSNSLLLFHSKLTIIIQGRVLDFKHFIIQDGLKLCCGYGTLFSELYEWIRHKNILLKTSQSTVHSTMTPWFSAPMLISLSQITFLFLLCIFSPVCQ